MSKLLNRRVPFGAELTPEGVGFRVWAPIRKRVEVLLEDSGEALELATEGEGFFSGMWPGLSAGARYRFRLDGGEALPDPASRFQPEGVHGPSQVVDPLAFSWSDGEWPGVRLPGQVIYEMHVGAFTPSGCLRAAEEKLGHLKDVGVTVIELMPLNEFHGQFGWGYDGVYWYAPTHNYGTPDDLRHFIDAAHAQGVAVILDVVYNHFGPTGNYMGQYSPYFASRRHPTEWGDAINYDGEGSGPVRQFVVSNAAYWIREFHFDGLRIDATQAIYDDSPQHVLADLSVAVREAAGERSVILIAENEQQEIRQTAPLDWGGYGLDGVWNDDFHHACRVAATGQAEFYYADYAGTPQELISASTWGYLYQGQYAAAAKRRRGTPAHQAPGYQFVNFLQNHDQVANSAHGQRLRQLTSPGRTRALTTLLLLAPGTPMLFMGQEFAASSPFLYFADHEIELAELVRNGRWQFLHQFPRIAGYEGQPLELHDPADRRTFEVTKLDWREAQTHSHELNLHRDLLALRRDDPAFSSQDCDSLHGAVIANEVFLLRWLRADGDDRLLLVNLGRDFHWRPVSEPLMAPPLGLDWRLRFSSDYHRYGGSGAAEIKLEDLIIPGHTASLLAPVVRDQGREETSR